MSIGGPVSFAAGLLEGLAQKQRRAQQQATTATRVALQAYLGQLREHKREEDAIFKEQQGHAKAQAEYAAAQRELDLAAEHRR